MAKPNELLAASLAELRGVTQNGTRSVVKSEELSRVHRERLQSNGFLEEIMKGWLAVNSRPSASNRIDAAWSTVYWEFVAKYLEDRFANEWRLSAEASVALWSENHSIPGQVIVRSPKANNQLVTLPSNTSLYLLRSRENEPAVARERLRLMPIEEAICTLSPESWRTSATDVIAVIGSIRGTNTLLQYLLDGGRSHVGGRIAGALRHLGRNGDADTIIKTLESAGYNPHEDNPFDPAVDLITLDARRTQAPSATRIKNLWAKMGKDAVDHIGFEQVHINDRDGYITDIDERYVADALNSLSIEGYEVSEELIRRVQDGQWEPDADARDYETKNALAAKGYRLAFEEVRDDIKKILDGTPTGELLEARHQDWFRAMFSPSVTAGIVKAHQLAGYRSHNVYLRGSSHVPLPPHAIADAMDALFQSISEEPDARVKAIVAPFLFTYIHPFPDGNGRTARFIMNALLAECGAPWTVIPVARRDEYMNALEEASGHENIVPLTKFVSELVNAPPPSTEAGASLKNT
ncbi:Fic family protein [Agrobacterium vitis]|uniref:Fic family protein n=1 Tax=Agrobacterium vitis TaxID=373 RepID=UPI001572474A|nr:Fic family protein [Agrobacterium vitis]NSY14939.1 Fic family protein [Agrobacterium vitis]NSY24696.1 Fic family protein [Agrobacterium vitis]WEO75317.1 Fic family protein [Agrobacterium vitis]